MIILVDHKNYAIRLCEDEADEQNIFISEERPTWSGEAMMLSDMGKTVVLTGDAAEEFLDDNNIYYIHVPYVAKENFENFKKRMNRMVEERRDQIDRNNSREKLVYGFDKDLNTNVTMDTDTIFKITRDLKTDEYHSTLNLPEGNKVLMLSLVIAKCEEDFGIAMYGMEPNDSDFYDDVNFSSGKSVLELISKLKMYRAIVMQANR